MKRTHLLCFLLGGLLLGPGVGVSRAGPITWDFTGTVTAFSDENSVLGDSIVVGSPYVGSITFESETPDSMPGDPQRGIFDGTLIDISGSVGSLMFAGPAGSAQFISVIDDPSAGDGFLPVAGVAFIDQLAVFRWDFVDSSGTAFTSAELPVAPLDLTSFDSTFIDVFSESGVYRGFIGVEITSITPDPGFLVLLLA